MSQRNARSLDDLFAVANSLHGRDAHTHLELGSDLAPGERHDHLDTPRAARTFLEAQGVRVPAGHPTRAELEALRALRGSVQKLATGRTAPTTALSRLLARHRYRLGPSFGFRPEGQGWSALVGDLLILIGHARAIGDRLKRCANRDCGWVFVDSSKNHSRQWCEMRTCGNRANLRLYRERLRRRRRATRRAP